MLERFDEQIAFDLRLDDALCVLTVGSMEQHSDYLPLGTDSLIGEAVTEAAAKEASCRVVLLPPQRVGYSPHHRAFPGCLTLTQSTLQAYLFELGASVFETGAKQLLIVNAHGGNQACLQAVVNDLGSRLGARAALVRYWDLLAHAIDTIRESGPGGMGHAGEFETSLMLYLYPELVDQSRIDTRAPAVGSEWHHPDMFAKNKVHVFKPFQEYTAKGNVGEPQHASREKGERIFTLAVSELRRLMEWQMEHGF